MNYVNYPPSHTDPLGSGSVCRYVWIWSGDMGFADAYGTGAVTEDRHSLRKCQPIVFQGSYHPNELGAAASSGNIFGFESGKGNLRLLVGGPGDKRRTKKLTCA